MKYYVILLMMACFVNLSFIKKYEKKVCPVYIGLTDSSKFDKDIIMAYKVAFGKYKIKTISHSQSKQMVDDEIATVTRAYYANGGSADWNETKRYLSNNQSYVVNDLAIKMTINDDGIVNDTIRWLNRPLPMDMANIKKNPWKLVILDSLRSNSLLEITDQVVEQIIASGELVKE